MNILNKVITLSLNSNWQPIGYKNVQDALSDLFCPNYKALNIIYSKYPNGEWNLDEIESMDPVSLDEWLELPVRDIDFSVRSAFLEIRVPTILIATNFNKLHKCKPKLTKQNIRRRDDGICQYTGRKLKPDQGNIDHVIPVSKGGANTWNNMVYCSKEINQKKGNKLPEELGLNLIKSPSQPNMLPTKIKKVKHRDWKIFID